MAKSIGGRPSEGARLLRQAKEREGLSVRALAAKIGKGASDAQRWLTGEKVPRTEMLLRLQGLFGIPLGSWFQSQRRKAA